MFDTRPALADMAGQIRACRARDGLTLQQLASRSGVAASTIHKVESQQMVPTVSVLLKISKGLGRRPEELIRDNLNGAAESGESPSDGALGNSAAAPRRAGVWRIQLGPGETLRPIDLAPIQRAIVVVEQGLIALQAGGHPMQIETGDCIELEGGIRIESVGGQAETVRLTLIVSPPGHLDLVLGPPSTAQGHRSTPAQQAQPVEEAPRESAPIAVRPDSIR